MLQINDKAPSLVAETDQGSFDLNAFKGKNVVVYFYPKDMTPGCTTEAQNFRDSLPDFDSANTIVVGVSKDSCKRHAKFREKNDLNFYLASDEAGTICEDWGVWREKKNYGKTYMGIVRSTSLVNAEGNIAQVWDKVRVKGHVEAVLKAAQNISPSS